MTFKVQLWGRFVTCSGFLTRLDACTQSVERRLQTGAQDTILPHKNNGNSNNEGYQ
jgi:hypothetical protein